ncbi:MAG TPA: hypothetical protein VM557_11435 [Thermoanaerobaculia bacterium]|nr:hypothetical protein [Thermoanaerobaculia bacterium]
MRYTKICGNCHESYTADEGEIRSLSQAEQLLCEKNGLDWPQMVKVICPRCGTESLVQRATLRPLASPSSAPARATSPPSRPDTALHMPSAMKLTKRCRDCAEEIQFEARICRYCRYEYDQADLEATIGKIDSAVAGLMVAQEQRRQIRRVENARVMVILLIHIGLIAPAGVLVPFVEQERMTGSEVSPVVPFLMLAIYAIFGALAVRQWRKASRMEADLAARAQAEGIDYLCACGRPKKHYSRLHYGLCLIVLPYGYISLLFPLKKCRDCGRPYLAGPAAALQPGPV